MSHLPRITIITPSFQQAQYLEECIHSVSEQDYPNVEHIVVDGGSTDGSKGIIEKHAAKLKWYCSEKDNGQSDAINKGLAHATGDVFTWLNSDDALTPGALHKVGAAFAADPQLRVFGGRVVHSDKHGHRVFERLNDANDAHRLFTDPVIDQPATYYKLDRCARSAVWIRRYAMSWTWNSGGNTSCATVRSTCASIPWNWRCSACTMPARRSPRTSASLMRWQLCSIRFVWRAARMIWRPCSRSRTNSVPDYAVYQRLERARTSSGAWQPPSYSNGMALSIGRTTSG
ncbi:MAG: glycosyltransferase [Flavobacteriales bacterium]|nr:glycosyltransferase [Flavobacteriales bacterium]